MKKYLTLEMTSNKYIEIKTRKILETADARKIVEKKCVSAVLTTGKIRGPAKELFDRHGIAYAENVPEKLFMESEAQEEG